ncbi:MAG: hypothetical protein CVV27_14270 [Candidatus Melainabacteria bacterium HGW-Melainabacteria-1]|nr:MAG: hypothetical protein CVV27_14270 [Candidatus Melainabacteria bacterium HGW-Melainabacteria-1]
MLGTMILAISLSGCGATGQGLPQATLGNYSLPLKLSQELECDGGSQLIYEITEAGEFRFLASEVAAKPVFITRKLSQADLDALDKSLEVADLQSQRKGSTPVPEDSPQTAECRAVDTLTLHVGAKDVAYDRNGRKLNHPESYRKAFDTIRAKLDALRIQYSPQPGNVDPNAPTFPRYGLPLQVTAEMECGMGTYTRFEVSESGSFRYAKTMPDFSEMPLVPPAMAERKLSDQEFQGLLQVLDEADLSARAVGDVTVPDDAPQTLECRTIEAMQLRVGGQAHSFDRNGRKLQHTEAYRQAFDKIVSYLQTLQLAPDQGVQNAYALPLKVRLDGECGLPDYTRFEIKANGEFSWTREDLPTFAPGNPPTENRLLTVAEQTQVRDKLNQLDLLNAAKASEVVPADAPQTKECRTVTVYDLNQDGGSHSLEGEGTRKFRHSQVLLANMAELQKLLYQLSGQPLPDHLK